MEQLPTRNRLIVAVLGLMVGALLATAGYLFLATAEGQLVPHIGRVWVQVLAAMVLVAVPALFWLTRSYARLRDQVMDGVPPQSLDGDDLRRTLELPGRVFAMLVWVWLLPCLLFPVAGIVWPQVRGDIEQVVVSGVTASFMLGITSYYGVLRVMRQHVTPVLLAHGRLPGHIQPTRVWTHLAFVLLLLGVVSPLTVATLAWTGKASPLLVTYLALDYLLVGAFVGAEVTAQISGAIGQIAGQMARVQAGDFDARARVQAADSLGAMASGFNDMVEGLQQRDELRRTLGRYVTDAVAEELLAGRIAPGGAQRFVTVLVTDVRGFTSMSEDMRPHQVIGFLNGLFEELVDAVQENGGVVNKFMGDALMAVWGAPTSTGSPELDAKAALAAAKEMQVRLLAINQRRHLAGQPPVALGLGIHSGEVVAGPLGSSDRTEYAVIGDAVNLAFRIEGRTKDMGAQILVSGATAELVQDVALVPRGAHSVKGRRQQVELFELPAYDGSDLLTEELPDLRS